jgi:hypothetical protein
METVFNILCTKDEFTHFCASKHTVFVKILSNKSKFSVHPAYFCGTYFQYSPSYHNCQQVKYSELFSILQ